MIWENGLAQYKCMEIFKTLNSRNFCVYWCVNLKLAEISKNRIICIVLKICKKIVNLNFDDVVANHK